MHPSAHSPNSTPRISPAKASSFKRKSKTSTLEQVTKKFREFHFIYLLKTKFANVSTYKSRVSNSGQKPIAKAKRKRFFFRIKKRKRSECPVPKSDAKRIRFAFASFRNKAKKANFLYSFFYYKCA